MKILGKNKKTQNQVTNFMGGISYTLNPLDTLKLVTASSIFGEPAYYRDGEFAHKGLSPKGRTGRLSPLHAHEW